MKNLCIWLALLVQACGVTTQSQTCSGHREVLKGVQLLAERSGCIDPGTCREAEFISFVLDLPDTHACDDLVNDLRTFLSSTRTEAYGRLAADAAWAITGRSEAELLKTLRSESDPEIQGFAIFLWSLKTGKVLDLDSIPSDWRLAIRAASGDAKSRQDFGAAVWNRITRCAQERRFYRDVGLVPPTRETLEWLKKRAAPQEDTHESIRRVFAALLLKMDDVLPTLVESLYIHDATATIEGFGQGPPPIITAAQQRLLEHFYPKLDAKDWARKVQATEYDAWAWMLANAPSEKSVSDPYKQLMKRMRQLVVFSENSTANGPLWELWDTWRSISFDPVPEDIKKLVTESVADIEEALSSPNVHLELKVHFLTYLRRLRIMIRPEVLEAAVRTSRRSSAVARAVVLWVHELAGNKRKELLERICNESPANVRVFSKALEGNSDSVNHLGQLGPEMLAQGFSLNEVILFLADLLNVRQACLVHSLVKWAAESRLNLLTDVAFSMADRFVDTHGMEGASDLPSESFRAVAAFAKLLNKYAAQLVWSAKRQKFQLK